MVDLGMCFLVMHPMIIGNQVFRFQGLKLRYPQTGPVFGPAIHRYVNLKCSLDAIDQMGSQLPSQTAQNLFILKVHHRLCGAKCHLAPKINPIVGRFVMAFFGGRVQWEDAQSLN